MAVGAWGCLHRLISDLDLASREQKPKGIEDGIKGLIKGLIEHITIAIIPRYD
jgi:hypothetical protein